MTNLETLAKWATKEDLAYKLTVACLAADVQSKLSTEAMEAAEADPENEALETASDELYNEFWDTCRTISAMLVRISGGMIDEKTALRMAVHKRAEIQNIYDKASQK